MIRNVKVDEAKNIFSELLEYVQKGNEVLFIDGNQPVAKLINIPAKKGSNLVDDKKDEKWTSDDFEIDAF